jgi:heterodisulfide reductase subunit A
MTSSVSLAEQGIDVALVERESELGGLARTAYYTIKGSDVQALLKDLTSKVEGNPKITVFTDSELAKLEGSWGNFTSIVKSNGDEKEIRHGAVIFATGGHEHKPKEYLYGANQNVVTQRELDALISSSEDASKIESLKSVVMIQCVGSRDDEHPYCSRVCCTHAVKNALKIREKNPNTSIYVLYRDMRTYGFFEKYYQKARNEGVIFVRYDVSAKPEVSSRGDGLDVSIYDPIIREDITINADLLVLSAGVEPGDVKALAEISAVSMNEDGFYKEANPKAAPLDAQDRGKFFAGLGHSPMLIEEAVIQGKAAAARAAVLLWNKSEKLPETQAYVNELVCTGCGQCVQVCPFNAISLNSDSGIATVDESLCRGCGTCAGTCRVSAITTKGYSDLQMLSLLNSI